MQEEEITTAFQMFPGYSMALDLYIKYYGTNRRIGSGMPVIPRRKKCWWETMTEKEATLECQMRNIGTKCHLQLNAFPICRLCQRDKFVEIPFFNIYEELPKARTTEGIERIKRSLRQLGGERAVETLELA